MALLRPISAEPCDPWALRKAEAEYATISRAFGCLSTAVAAIAEAGEGIARADEILARRLSDSPTVVDSSPARMLGGERAAEVV
jgi:hypothetical protein